MTRSLRGKDGQLDALPNSDGFRDLVIRPESAESTKNVATRVDGRSKRHAEGKQPSAGRKSMNRTAGIRKVALGALAVSSLFAGGSAAFAQQQTTGTPGSPDATTTVDSRYLPPPPLSQRFESFGPRATIVAVASLLLIISTYWILILPRA
jgi:hypothetical protein